MYCFLLSDLVAFPWKFDIHVGVVERGIKYKLNSMKGERTNENGEKMAREYSCK